jgi:small basic protein (TIGR04137 family)
MSVHKTLRSGDSLTRSRNVLTRYERILQLERQGDFEEGQSPYGLRKTRIMKIKKRGKTKKKKDEDKK